MMTTSQRPGLKTGGKNIFWSEKGSGFGEKGATPPPRIPKSTPWEGWWEGGILLQKK